MRKIIFLSILIFLLFASSLLFSNIIIVDTTGAGNYITIQEGINAAANGDTVLVYPGTYYENMNYNGKNITVASLYIITEADSFIYQTIIDGNQNGSVVTFGSGEDTTAVLCGFTIQNGSGTSNLGNIRGGGIFIKDANPQINSCIITNNIAEVGGGIHCRYSNISLENTTIRFNHAFFHGGGIYLRDDSTINFSSINRCNIYNNYAAKGCDFCSYEVLASDIIVDTFTVLEPDEYFIQTQPENNFTLDILNGWIDPANQDLYVNPDGDNTNSGLIENEPLKSISWALTKIASDSTHPNTIHLANGIYSLSLTNEMFPLNCRSYVSIIGEYEENTVLNGENISSLIWNSYGDNYFSIENLTIQNGYSYIGGGLYINKNSNPIIKNVTLKDNFADIGTSIFCIDNCNPIFENVKIKSQLSTVEDAAISLYSYCNPTFINCIIEDNNNENFGTGAIYCNGHSTPILINTRIINNNAYYASGITMYNGSEDESPYLINCTICNNQPCLDGTIRLISHCYCTLINSILRNPNQNEIYFEPQHDPDTVTISYTNIDGGIDAINTNNNGTIHWLEGNIDSLPQFVGGDPFSYELLPGSPCIDAGNPDTTGLNLPPYDLSGQPRIYNGIIDMGAYEWQGQGIEEPDTSFINKLYLFQNKPNPFSSSTTIIFISADYERLKDYKLSIYNARGQLIKTYNGKKHNFWVKTDIVWDGKNEDGKKVSPGIYFYKLEYGDNAITKKMILVR